MQSKWAWIILNLVVCAIASVEDDNVKAFIQLTEYGYVDVCLDTTEAQWAFLNSPSNKTLSEWEEKLISYARFKILQMDEVANISKNDIHDSALLYKYDVAIKIGDALLHTDDLKNLVHFAGAAELQRLSRVRDTILKNHTRKDLENILSHSSNVENKSAVWTAWHQGLAPLVKNFSTILPLVSKAAKANGAKNVTEYWEFLSGYSEGYDKIKYEWSRLASLHKKILKFAINNLSQKYKITMNNTIPAYLLGSLQGSDWTPISVDVTPYPDLMYSIKKNLWKRRLIGKSLYKTASIMSSQILSQAPQAGFWGKSRFDQQCPSKLINFCQDAILSVSTCFEPTISNYLSAHKNVGKIVFNQISVEDTPVLNTANRYSGLEEGVSELFGILAASPAWLNYTHLMDNSTDSEQRLIVSLMITALNTLPQITYYMSADMWRIDAIEKGITNPEDLISSWWKHREEYEGLNSNGTNMPTFLDDDYITSNKPYLPKLTGTILAFQLYKYLMASTAVRYDSIVEKHININFLKMIQRGSADDWMKVLDKFLELDEVSFDSLLSFFSPLEDFIDELEENIQYKADTAKESELEELEKRVIVEMNTPSTTTTTTTTPRSVAGKTKTTSTSSSKQNDGRSGMNTVGNSNKNLESKSSILIPENSNILDVPTITEVPLDKSQLDSLDTDDDKKPKINTSKAVWAVGAVLLATIVICIIAIFGRQRCRKTPKNRRYV